MNNLKSKIVELKFLIIKIENEIINNKNNSEDSVSQKFKKDKFNEEESKKIQTNNHTPTHLKSTYSTNKIYFNNKQKIKNKLENKPYKVIENIGGACQVNLVLISNM